MGGTGFTVMDQHLAGPRPAASFPRLVLSRLGAGRSVIAAPGPSVKLVVEGEEVYEVDGRRVAIRPGQFLYLEGGEDCLGSNRDDTTGVCLLLPPDVAAGSNGWSAGPLFGRAVPMSVGASPVGRFLFHHARRIARNPELGKALAPQIAAQVAVALHEPLSASRAAADRLQTAKPSTRRELYQRLDRARSHLHQHADRNLSLAELARVAGLSQFHLARYFKLAFGAAPIAYHRALRLERAATLLAGGGTVAQAAHAAGYSDETALSHAFRRQYGRPPQQWAMAAVG